MFTLKAVGLGLGGLGLLAAFLNILGCFADKERKQLCELIRTSEQVIPAQTPGFKAFLAEFPPPQGVSCISVSHIVKQVLQTHDKFPLSITLRYLADGKRTEAVASYEDVRRWAEKTVYGWLSWVIAAIGWCTVVAVELIEKLGRDST